MNLLQGNHIFTRVSTSKRQTFGCKHIYRAVKMSNSKDVQGHLETIAAGGDTGRQKLTFDPTTGKLKVVNANQNTGDSVVCTDMAAAGFFIRMLSKKGTTYIIW